MGDSGLTTPLSMAYKKKVKKVLEKTDGIGSVLFTAKSAGAKEGWLNALG